MGRRPSEKPKKLARKLKALRVAFGVSQGGLIERLGLAEKLSREDISKYERGLRVPALLTLLAYARAGGVTVDSLLDDAIDLTDLGVSKHKPAKK